MSRGLVVSWSHSWQRTSGLDRIPEDASEATSKRSSAASAKGWRGSGRGGAHFQERYAGDEVPNGDCVISLVTDSGLKIPRKCLGFFGRKTRDFFFRRDDEMTHTIFVDFFFVKRGAMHVTVTRFLCVDCVAVSRRPGVCVCLCLRGDERGQEGGFYHPSSITNVIVLLPARLWKLNIRWMLFF